MCNLRKHEIDILFNCPNSPALNIVELVFADLKYSIRKENKSNTQDILKAAIDFFHQLNESKLLL